MIHEFKSAHAAPLHSCRYRRLHAPANPISAGNPSSLFAGFFAYTLPRYSQSNHRCRWIRFSRRPARSLRSVMTADKPSLER